MAGRTMWLVRNGSPLDEVLGWLVRSLERMVPSATGAIWLLDLEGKQFVDVVAPGLERTQSASVTGLALNDALGEGSSSVTQGLEVSADLSSGGEWARRGSLQGFRSGARVLLADSDGPPAGLLTLYSRSEWTPSPGDLEAIEQSRRAALFVIWHDAFARRLQLSERRYRTLVEKIPVVTYSEIRGTSDAYIIMSPQIQAWSGYSAEEWITDPAIWARLIHPDDRERVLAASDEADRTGEAFRQEYRLRHRDGHWRWVLDEAVQVSTGPSEPLTWQGVLSDVHERKLAEMRLHEAEARYRTLVEQIPAITYVSTIGEGYPLQYISPQTEAMTGHAPQQYLDDAGLWESQMHPEDRDRAIAEFQAGLASGRPFATEYRMLTADGRRIWVRDECVYLPSIEGSPRLVQGVIFDITKRKEAEERLSKSVEELRKTDGERRRLMSRLVTAQEEERRRIAGDIHDDAIQKISALAMRLDMLRYDHPEIRDADRWDKLQQAAVRSIESLRTLMFEIRPYSLDRDGLAATLRLHFREQEKREGSPDYELVDELGREPPTEVRTVLYRIAQEAIANARVHASPSRVEVLLREEARGFFMKVADDGRGFDANRMRESVPGHLGLTSMRERAEMAGGWWAIHSSPGEGTEVEVWVPGEEADEAAAS